MFEKINWVKIMEDNRESIEETIREAKKETYNTMQGWHYDVEINEKGESWTSGPHSNSQSMSSYKGETYIVCSLKSWSADYYDVRDYIRYDKELNDEFLVQKENEDGYDSEYEFIENIHPEKLDEWTEDEKEAELSEFDPSELLDRAIQEEKWSV